MKTYRNFYTKPIPENAKFITKKGERFAKFIDAKGKQSVVPVTTTSKGEKLKYECSFWTLNFVDNNSIQRRLKAYSLDKDATERLGSWIIKLMQNNGILDNQLFDWFIGCLPLIRDQIVKYNLINKDKFNENIDRIDTLPDNIQKRLIESGLIDRELWNKHTAKKKNMDKTLDEHLKDFKEFLLAKGNDAHYSKQVKSDLSKMFSECQFKYISDIDANLVSGYLKGRRDKGLGEKTSNAYLKSAKQFCRWAIKAQRSFTVSPLEYLDCMKVTEKRRKRRVLEIDELLKLLETAKASTEERYGLSGYERYFLYRLATETGLRANELRSLTVSSFDFNSCTVTVEAGYSKRRRRDVLPLRPDTVQELKTFFDGKLPTVKAFCGRYKQLTDRTAEMIKEDLEEAGIDYCVVGRYFDFHSLRHETGTLLATSGVEPKVAQELLRHSDINLTMSIYTHTLKGEKSRAVAKLPNLAIEPNKKNLKSA